MTYTGRSLYGMNRIEDNYAKECISVKRYITHNCVENCIANLCDSYKIDHRPLFLFSWDFGFKKTSFLLEDNVHFNYNFDTTVYRYYDISKIYLNISFIPNGTDSSDIMRKLNKGNIMLITSDAYNLPWNLAFGKYHVQHSFLVLVDSVNHCLKVIDSFCSNDFVVLENLNGIDIIESFLIKLKKNEKIEYLPDLLEQKYLAILETNIKRDIFDLIKEFGDSVKEIDSVDKIMNLENELSESYFLRKLNYITNARSNTKSFFEYLQWPNKYVDLMNDIYREWTIVKNLFIKFILSNELNLIPQISRQLHEIAILEKDLCNTIIKEET